MVSLLFTGGCDGAGDHRLFLTVYGFSITRGALEEEIMPAFARKWKAQTGQELMFSVSFAGSETITNQILAGAPADIALFALSRDVDRLVAAGATRSDWHSRPHGGIINRTPLVIVVRKGNPHGIRDMDDLARPGIEILHPDPFTSGGAQWSIVGLYGAALLKSERDTGRRDPVKAQTLLTDIWRNVIGTPGSAREARTQFEAGFGDALITYEQEWIQMEKKGGPFQGVIPRATIFSEHPAALIDRNLTGKTRPAAEAFLAYLWSDEAQNAFVRAGFRSVTDSLNLASPPFSRIEQPMTIEDFGGWKRAYPELIEDLWKQRVSHQAAGH
jgi:sulfate transport system substrate-binding protein